MSDDVHPDTPPTHSEPEIEENDPSKPQELHEERYTVREEEVAPSQSRRPPSSMNKKFTFFRRESIRPESRYKKNLPPSAKTHSLESELHRSSSPSLAPVALDAPIPGIENSRHRFRPVSEPSSVELKEEEIDTVAAVVIVDAELEAKKPTTPKKHKSRLQELPTEARAKKKEEKELTPQEAYELSIKVGENLDDKKKLDEIKRQNLSHDRSPSPAEKRTISPTKKRELSHEELEIASPIASPAKGPALHVNIEPEPVIELRRQSSSASESLPPSPSPQLMQEREITDSPSMNTVESPLMQRLMQRRESSASFGSPERSPSPGEMLRQASIFLTEIQHGDFSSGRSSPSSRSYRRKKQVLPEVEMVRFSDVDQDPIGVQYKDLAEKCCKYLTLDNAEDLEIFSQYFTSEDNKEVIKHMFWFVFCAFFQQGDVLGQNVEQLLEQLSVYATRVAWSIPHEHNDKFFSMYHTALAYSIIKAMRKHFTGSKKKFTRNWESRVLELVSELVTGIRLKKSLLEEEMDKLFNKEKRKKREAEKRRKERDEAAKAPRKMSVVGPPKPRDFYSSDEDDAFDAAVEDEIFITDDEFSANLETIGKDDVPFEALHQGRGMTERSVHFAGSSANTPRTRRSSAKEGSVPGILKKASKPNSAVSSLSEKSSFSASTTQQVRPSRPHTEPATPLPALSIASSVSSSRPHSRESSRSSISDKTERDRVQEKSSPRYETDAYRSLLKRLLDKTSWDGSGVEDKFFVTYAASPLIRTSGIREPTEYYKRPQAMCLPRGRDVTGTRFFSSSMEGHRAEKRETEFRDRWENPRSMEMLEKCMAERQIMDQYLEGIDQRLDQQMQDIADRDKENQQYRTAHYNRIRQEPSGEKMRVLVETALAESENKHFPPQVIAEAVFNNRSMKVQAHILYEQERNNAELKSALHDVHVQLKRAVKEAKKKRDHRFRKQLVLNAHKPKFDVQVP